MCEPEIFASRCLGIELHKGQQQWLRESDARENILVTGNRCTDDQEKATQKAGIEEGEGSDRNLIANNLCRGNAEGGTIVVGSGTVKQGNVE